MVLCCALFPFLFILIHDLVATVWAISITLCYIFAISCCLITSKIFWQKYFRCQTDGGVVSNANIYLWQYYQSRHFLSKGFEHHICNEVNSFMSHPTLDTDSTRQTSTRRKHCGWSWSKATLLICLHQANMDYNLILFPRSSFDLALRACVSYHNSRVHYHAPHQWHQLCRPWHFTVEQWKGTLLLIWKALITFHISGSAQAT